MLADRLEVPAGTAALLFDMDGVLLDTLTTDFIWIHDVLNNAGHPRDIRRQDVLDWFSVEVSEMWDDLVIRYKVPVPSTALLEDYNRRRRESAAVVHAGIIPILEDARSQGLGIGVVSNNKEREINALLQNSGILSFFDHVTGNDGSLAKKPAPDMYLEGARRCGFSPGDVVAIEDSLIGAQAAFDAGCYVVGVATGAIDLQTLRCSNFVHATYECFG
jgi:HAD superfamily hydrolase (TIGR01509 family)